MVEKLKYTFRISKTTLFIEKCRFLQNPFFRHNFSTKTANKNFYAKKCVRNEESC